MHIRDAYRELGVDYDELLHRFPREEFIRKYIDMFLRDDNYRQLEQAVEEGDYDEALRAAHTLKGLARNMEFPDLFQSCFELVECIRSGRHERVGTLFEQVQRDHTALLSLFNDLE